MIQDDELEASRLRLGNAMRIGVAEKPDALAADRAEATRLGVSVGALRLARQQGTPLPPPADLQELPRTAPRTTSFLSEPSNAAVAHDSVRELSEMEQVIARGAFSGQSLRPGRPAANTPMNWLRGIGGAVADAFTPDGTVATGARIAIGDLLGSTALNRPDAAGGRAFNPSSREMAIRDYRAAAAQQDALRPDIEGPIVSGIYGGATSLARSLPGLALSIATANPLPALASGGFQTSGDAYGKYTERGATIGEATLGALGEGSVEVATELIPMGTLVSKFGKEGLGAWFGKFVLQDALGEQVATAAQDALDTAIANPDKTWGEYFAERPNAAIETAVATLVQSGAIGGASSAASALASRQERQQARAAAVEADAEAVAQINAFAETSKLRERSAETFEQFIAEASVGGPVENLYVDGQVLNQAIQDAGIDPATLPPAVTEQLANAAETGGDVTIPVEQFAARIAGTDLSAPLLDHLRVNPLLPSRAEVQNASSEELRATVEQILVAETTTTEFKASAERVKASFVEQLTTAGRFTNDVNAAYATLVSDFYTVQAARLGITPEAMAERYPLRIRSENPGAPREQVLDQEGEQVSLSHFSKATGLAAADPSRWGMNSATPAGERQRVGTAPGRTYFYDRSVRQEPEGAIRSTSPFQYAAKIPRAVLYDFDADPQGLRGEGDASAYETAIQAAGFRGYFSNATIEGAVAVFDALPLEPVGAVRTQEDAAFVSRRMRELQQADRLARVAETPGEMVTAQPIESFRQQAELEIPLAGAPRRAKIGDQTIEVVPSAAARQAALNYMEQRGLPYEPPREYAKVDTGRAQRIAAAFDEMAHAPNDPLVRAAYRAMIDETLAQYQAIKATGLEIEFIDFAATGDPYALTPRQAIQDVIENNHLWVFPTDEGFGSDDTDITGNPLLEMTDEFIGDRQLRANDVFRIVHDYFGHIKDGNGFRADGEENAWQSHAAMYTPLARRAMTTETRGQNSWVNYGPNGESNRTASAADTVYAPQKIGLLPQALSEEGFLGGGGTLNQSSVPLLDNPLPIEGKVTIKAVGEALTAEHMRTEGRALYPENDEADYARVLDAMRDEVRAQLQQPNSGVGWYSADVQQSIQMAARVYPTLLTEPTHSRLFLTFAGILSNGNTPEQAFVLSAEAFEAFLADGKVPVGRAAASAVRGVEASVNKATGKPTGWSVRNAANEQQLALVNYLVDREGSLEAALDWLITPQPRASINEAMQSSGLYKAGRFTTKAEIAGPDTPGYLAFGEKLGRYTMGLQGYEIDANDVTIDLWYTRTYRRHVGRLLETPVGPEGVVGGPTDADRRVIFRLSGDLAKEFDLAPGDLQAVLWFWEKRLWGAQGVRTSEGTNSSGAAKLLQSKGLGDGGGRAADQAVEENVLYQSDPAVGQPPFYSALARAVSENQTKRASAEQWKATLAKTPGVKKDEIEWSGVNDWLDGQVGAVDREALATYLQQGGVQLEEVVLGTTGDRQRQIETRTDELVQEAVDRSFAEGGFVGRTRVEAVEGGYALFWGNLGRNNFDETFASEEEAQTAANNANDAEVLSDAQAYGDEIRGEYRYQAEREIEDDPLAAQFGSYKLPGADDSYREVLLTLPAIQGPSTHWDTENVVAHARITERADATGARVLFIEEVQSDWHQKGRDEGYANQQDPDRVAEALDVYQKAQDDRTKVAADFVEILRAQLIEDVAATEEARDAAVDGSEGYRENLANGVNELKNALGRLDSELASEDGNSVSAARLASNMLRRSRDGGLMLRRPRPLLFAGQAYEDATLNEREARVALDALSSGGIPDAPFRTSWSALVMKRMIRYAVDNGFDKVAWINGNQQNGGQTGGDGSFFYERNLVNTTNDLLKKLGGRVEPVDMRDPERLARIEQERAPSLETRRELLADAVAEGDPAAIERAQERVDGYIADGERLLAGLSRPARNLGVQNGFVINDRMRETAAGGFPLFQQNRGQITFGQDITQTPSTISLLRTADLSTFLHETGHFFLEVQAHIANSADAPAEVVADMEATLNWFRPGMTRDEWSSMSLDAKREYHEKFARGFEAYLLEGNAPTSGLRDVFRRFRSWLLNVYKSMSALNVELTDEVRQVMGRMVGSAEAIKEAEDEMSFAPIFESRPPFMNEAAWAEYQRSFAASTEEGMDMLSTRTVRDMQWLSNAKNRSLKLLQRDAKEARKQVRAEVAAEVRAEPVNRARAFLTRGLDGEGNPAEGAGKLDIDTLRQMYGEETTAMWRGLKVGGKFGEAGKGGLNPDAVAELFGFESGDALVRALVSAEDMNAKIAGMTDQRMLERYGDISDEQALDRAANESVANDARARFVATEFAALAQATGQPRALAEAARQYAAGIVNKMVLKRLKPAQFFAAQTRAAKAADKALKNDDLVAAATQKRNQLINLQAARYTIKAQADVDKALRLFTRIVSAKDDAISRTRDMNLVNASRAILAAHGIGRVKNDPISYMDLVKRYDPAVYADLQPYVETAMRGAKNVEEMTFEEFQGMRDSVAQLWALSRRTKQIVIDGQTMQLEAVREELSARLDEIMPAGRTGMTEDPDEKARIGRSLQGIRAAMRRVESWARATDGGDKGPFRRYVWNPISEAADRYRVAQTTYLQRYLEVIKPIEETLTNARIAAPEINHTFNGKAQLLHAILHTGNLSNKSKLLLGRSWGKQTAEGALDSTTWDALVERFIAEGTLTKADFDVVQAIWDLMEETKPGAQQAHQAIYGRFFAEVTADEVVTSLGTYRGGYVPALTDSFFVQDAALREEQRALEESDSAMFPAASNGFTKARVEDYTRELALDMRLLPMHIDKVLRFTHMGPPVRDVARLLKGKALSQKMHAFDPVAQTDLLLPWLQRAATQQVQTPSKGQGGKLIDAAFRTIRSRVGMQLMFANVSNTLQQVTGFSSLLARVKQARLRDAMWTYVRDPKGTADAVVALSSFMATRTSGQMFEVRQSIDQMLMNPTQYEKLRDFSSRHGYFMQTMAQNFVDVIGWTAAYNQAVARGDNDLEAVRFADSVIRETQGSMAAEDVSRFETGSAFTRLFTQFVGYFNMTANLNATEFLNVQRGIGVPKGAGRLAYVYVVAFAIPALLADLIAQGFRGELGDEDDDGYMDDFLSWFFGSQGKFALAMIPGAGPAALAAVGGFTEKPFDDKISLSPGISVAESSVRAPSQIYKTLVEGESFGRRDVRDTMTFLGLLTGTPLGALGRPVGYVAGVAQGEIEPTGPVDFARGVITGSASPESRE